MIMQMLWQKNIDKTNFGKSSELALAVNIKYKQKYTLIVKGKLTSAGTAGSGIGQVAPTGLDIGTQGRGIDRPGLSTTEG